MLTIEMRDRLIGLIKQATTSHLDYLESIDQKGLTDTDGRAKFIADHLLANGVIVPPCKVGQIVYPLMGGFVEEMKVSRFVLVLKPNERHPIDYIKEISDIGKTVLLTKEEAEKALRERDGNG